MITDFEIQLQKIKDSFLNRRSLRVDVGEWQAKKNPGAFSVTYEITDVRFIVGVPQGIEEWGVKVQPNMPWAEDHFQERVSGQPLNPPPSHEWWPFNVDQNIDHTNQGKFSHTYPERIWAKDAIENRSIKATDEPQGIRFNYGDLEDVVMLMKRSPYTRQAYLPIWFPEDTGARHGERVPCTIGYHFLTRRDSLTLKDRTRITYFIRSCDFIRYFRDDVYMAGRLLQWMCNQLGTEPDKLVMNIISLHIFKDDLEVMRTRRIP